MSKNSGEYFNEWIKRAESDPKPINRWMGRSVVELFVDGGFEIRRVQGTDLAAEYRTAALRMVALNGADMYGVTLLPDDKNQTPQNDEYLTRAMRDQIKRLNYTPHSHEEMVVDFMRGGVEAENRQVLAAMELGTTIAGGESVAQVWYPKTFIKTARDLHRSLGLPTDDTSIRDLAYGSAVSFLKRAQPESPRIINIGRI